MIFKKSLEEIFVCDVTITIRGWCSRREKLRQRNIRAHACAVCIFKCTSDRRPARGNKRFTARCRKDCLRNSRSTSKIRHLLICGYQSGSIILMNLKRRRFTSSCLSSRNIILKKPAWMMMMKKYENRMWTKFKRAIRNSHDKKHHSHSVFFH